jgi:hypothetical protein
LSLTVGSTVRGSNAFDRPGILEVRTLKDPPRFWKLGHTNRLSKRYACRGLGIRDALLIGAGVTTP